MYKKLVLYSSLLIIAFFLSLSNSSAQIIKLASQETMWLDANECGPGGPQGAWLCYKIINNTPTVLTDLDVTFSGFTGTDASLFLPPMDTMREFSSIAIDDSVSVYYYVDYSAICGVPTGGGGCVYDGYTADFTISVSSVENGTVSSSRALMTDCLLTANAAGTVTSSTVGPGVYAGQILEETVEYEFGNNSDIFFQPAGDALFPDLCFRLVGSEITAVTGSVPPEIIGLKDALHFPELDVPGGGGTISVTYYWEVIDICIELALHPWAAAKSGQKYKYTGFNGAIIFPEGSQALEIVKSVDPEYLPLPTSDGGYGSGIAEWTISLTNTNPDLDIVVDTIHDQIPSCMTISNAAVTGSDVNTSNSVSIPLVGSTESVKWIGVKPAGDIDAYEYRIPPEGTIHLIYQTDVTNCPYPASYENLATADLGNSVVGPVSALLTIGCVSPDIDNPGSQIACDSYALPTISGTNLVDPQYYDNSQAMGGIVITGPINSTMTVWIYDEGPEGETCSDEESFLVTINNTPDITNPGPQEECDSYTLPLQANIAGSNLVDPRYYNNTQASGLAVEITDLTLTTTQTVWIYDETGTIPNCSDEESFVVTINNTPDITNPGAQEECDSYTLPLQANIAGTNLVDPKYYTNNQASGLAVEITNLTLTSTQTIWIYDETATLPNCSDEESFVVTINDTPDITNPGEQEECDSYTLPLQANIAGSNLVDPKYYTNSQASGLAVEITDLTLTTSQTVWIYDETATTPNCSDEESFIVTINYTPEITNPGPQEECDSYTLTLQANIAGTNLVDPKYYTNSQASGLAVEITDLTLTTTQTVWIYDETATTPNCSDEESFVVTINDTPDITNPNPQEECDSYTLPIQANIAGSNLVDPKYYTNSQASGLAVEITDLTLTTSQTVWIYDETATTPNCFDEESFEVTINDTPDITNPGAQEECDSYTLPLQSSIGGTNLVDPKYYTNSQASGTAVEITDLTLTTTQTVWIYDETGSTPNCFDEESFVVTINDTPDITNPGPQEECGTYTLPLQSNITGTNLVDPKYYTNSQASGLAVEITDLTLTTTQTVWIYDETATTPNCSDEESFEVTINFSPIITNPGPQEACDSYTLPLHANIAGSNLQDPRYYTNTQASGLAVEITDLTLTTTQTVWIYDETGSTPNCFDEESFVVTINYTPDITNPGPQEECDSYTLPLQANIAGTNLVDPKYFTDSQASGLAAEITDLTLTTTQTVWVYDETATTPNCSDEVSFVVTINYTPNITNPGPQEECDSYTLPLQTNIAGTNLVDPKYYTNSQASGLAVEITNLSLTTSQTVWIYDETATTPNCSDEVNFVVTINDTPDITNPGAQEECDSYTLPLQASIAGSNLVDPKYYTNSQASGLAVEITDLTLTTTQTVWIYDETATTPNCFDEESFEVTINNTPDITNPGAQEECDSYTLPLHANIAGNNLVDPKYYTNSQASGLAVEITDLTLTTTQTVWIYDETATTPNCFDEESFEVTINDTPDITNPGAQEECDSYTLPLQANIAGSNLVDPKYYTNSQASGLAVEITDLTLTTTQTVWIYDETASTPNCSDEESIVVTINDTPDITNPGPQEECGTYTLPLQSNITGTNLVDPRYYTNSQASGLAVEITDLTLTTTQTVWIYDETATTPNCSDEESFEVTINFSPIITNPGPQEACDSYTLPLHANIAGSNLQDPRYYTNTQASGLAVEITDLTLTTTQTVWIYDETGSTPNCFDEEPFVVTINDTPDITNPGPQEECDSYTLPLQSSIAGSNLNDPKYYTNSQASGLAVEITNLTLTTTQTVWIYDETATTPNCFDEVSFVVTINYTPDITNPGPHEECDSYTLPLQANIAGSNLVDPKYYTNSQASGLAVEITDLTLTTSQTVWIYDETATTPNCSDEESFAVTINYTPEITNPGPQEECDSYTLTLQANIAGTNLVDPKYYTNSQASGLAVEITDLTLTTTQTVWIYDETATTPNCFDEESFEVTINNTPDITNPGAQEECDSYTLPLNANIAGNNLVDPKYYTNSQASGLAVEITDLTLTTTQTVWIYDETATTPNCFDEESFEVTINDTPDITNPGAQEECDSYTLPLQANIAGSNLVDPKYYTNSQVSGLAVEITDLTLTTTQTVWIYDETASTPNCSDEESIVVTINDTPDITNPGPQEECGTYTLPLQSNITGTNLVDPKYYTNSQASGLAVEITDLTLTTTQTVWIYDETATTPNCSDEESFEVTINFSPIITNPGPQEACDSYTLPLHANIAGSNLQDPRYYTNTQASGLAVEITDLTLTTTQTVWIYDETGSTPNCFDEEPFVVTINDTPDITNPGPQEECDSYTLPLQANIAGTNLVDPKYFTDSQASGLAVEITDLTLTTSQTVWIYDETATMPNCSDEESFVVTINDTPDITNPGAQEECDSYTLPLQANIAGSNLVDPKYYNNSQASGLAVEVTDLTLTTTQTVWIYDETATTPNCSDEVNFVVTINDTPDITNPGAQEECDSYTLPLQASIAGSNLVDPKYYTNSQASGLAVEITDLTLTTTQTVWIYDETATTPNCSDEENFVVTINDTPDVTNPGAQDECDSYTLPLHANIAGNNLVDPKYYTNSQASGLAVEITDLTLTTTQTVWIYDETATTPNCFDEESFEVTINDTPDITNPGAQEECDSYTLPLQSSIGGTNLVDPKYYTNSQVSGLAVEITDLTLTTTQTVWIYDETVTTPNCSDEESFVVTINDTPDITNPGPQEECGTYTLPLQSNIAGTNLVDPRYYTNSQASGLAVEITDLTLTTTQTVWIYDETATTPNCSDEISFEVTINFSPVITNPGPQEACDSYTLPLQSNIAGSNLQDPRYYDNSQASGLAVEITDLTLSTTQTVWIYDETGTIPNCYDEESFVVTINYTPEITNPGSQSACDFYTLPLQTNIEGSNLNNPRYYTNNQASGLAVEITNLLLTMTQTVWIYDETGTIPSCSDEESFVVTINNSPVLMFPELAGTCDIFTLPLQSEIAGYNLVNPRYYTNSQASGLAEEITDLTLTTSQTVWIYDETGTIPNCYDEISMSITVNNSPELIDLGTQHGCESVTLPFQAEIEGNNLVDPRYYSNSQASGLAIEITDLTLTTSQIVWIYDSNPEAPECYDELSFEVIISRTPEIFNPGDITSCGPVTLLPITGTNLTGNQGYYDDSQANGGIRINGQIDYSMRVWMYDETNTIPNCSDEESFYVTIYATGTLVCNEEIRLSVDENCKAIISADMFLEASNELCDDYYSVYIDAPGFEGINVNHQYIELPFGSFDVTINNFANNVCNSMISVFDNIQPTISCPDGAVDIYCHEVDDYEPEVDDNCSIPTITIINETITTNLCDGSMPDNIFRIIQRTYVAEDASGNVSEPCTVTINVNRLPDDIFYNNIYFPEDKLVSTGSAFSCSDNYPIVNNGCCEEKGHPAPEASGSPYLVLFNEITMQNDTIYLYPGSYEACNLYASFTDLEIVSPNPECISFFERIWTVHEFSCSPTPRFRGPHSQMIEIADFTNPEVICGDDITITSNTIGDFTHNTLGQLACGAFFTFPAPLMSDNCSTTLDWDISVATETSDPITFIDNADPNNLPSRILPIGTNEITYTVYDACGHSSSCTFKVIVVDETPPVAVCQEFTTVALTYDGFAEVHAWDFDSGSYDDCSIVRMQVKRMDDGSDCDLTPGDGDVFKDYVTFCCNDIGTNVMVQLGVWDIAGNYNECMVEVEVQDKTPPVISCPPNMEVSCDFYYDADAMNEYFGEASVHDNCSAIITVEENFEINQCGVGHIERIFTATDPGNLTDQCTQYIYFNNYDPFWIDENWSENPDDDVVWPGTYSTIACLNPDELNPDITGWPDLLEGPCDKVGFNYSDVVYPFNDDDHDNNEACLKIIRTWKVTDECQGDDTSTEDSRFWTYDQIIMVSDNVGPEFTTECSYKSNCTYDPDCNDGFIELIMSAEDLCTMDEDLKWKIRIDLYNDNPIDVYDWESEVLSGSTIQAMGENGDGTFPIGEHRIFWTTWDQCGNKIVCDQLFSIINCKKPTIVCQDDISTTLMGVDTNNDGEPDWGMIDIKASTCIECCDYAFHPCGYPVVLSFSEDINDTIRTFTCLNIGDNPIEIWATAILPDGTYTQDFCKTSIDIQDNSDVCNGITGQYSNVSGLIQTNVGIPVEEVSLKVEGSELGPQSTDEHGLFSFYVPQENSYLLKPQKDGDDGQGVSTLDLVFIQKHLLSIQKIDSPYSLIAADVDNNNKISASDLFRIRKLILGVDDAFEKCNSWTFVEDSYEFENPDNPLNENYPVNVELNQVMGDREINYVAIKMGDLNNSYNPFTETDLINRNIEGLKLLIDDQHYSIGNQIEVPVYSDNFYLINGFQYTIDFDSYNLSFVALESGALSIGSENLGLKNIDSGLLAISWSEAKALTLDNSEPLFTIIFNVSNSNNLSNTLHLSNQIVHTEAYDENLEIIDIELSFRFEEEFEFDLLQNQPNPFSNETSISFIMPESSFAAIKFYDLNGRLLKSISGHFDKGMNKVNVSTNDLKSSGLIYYQLQAGINIKTKKMMTIN